MQIKKNMPLITLVVLCLISSLAATILLYKYVQKINTARATALNQARSTTQETSQHINRFIETLEAETKRVFHAITTTSNSTRIEQELRKKPLFVTGLAVIELNKQNNQITGSYFVEKNGEQQLIPITSSLDNKTTAHLFFEQLKNGLDTYAGPLVDPYTDEQIIVYAKAHDTTDKMLIIFATQSLSHLRHVLNTLYMGKQGYWFIADGTGKIIVHPRTIFTERPTFLQDFATITNTALDSLITSAQGTLIYNNEVTQQPSWLIYQKIPQTGWTLCGVFEQLQARIPHNENRHYLMLISLSILLSFLLLMFIITLLFTTARAHQWMLTMLASCACTATIGVLWYIAKTYPAFGYDTQRRITPIENKVALYTFLDSLQTQKTTEEQSKPDDKRLDYYLAYRYKVGRYIPTGVFIHYMHFISESQVQIVGYVWQRYFDGTHDGIMRGFVLPQATSDVSITEVFHTKVERQETIIWRVNATLNQEFSYMRYPFDTREITIQLWHADFGKNIILVPDLDSYPLMTATSLPGLSANAYIPNWQFKNSYFGYQKYLYNSLFGLYTYGPFGIYNLFNKSYTPELHFVAKTQRLLTDTLVDDLLPLFLIAFLLFVVFITDIGHGFQVFAAYASIFFGIVVAQLNFRGKIPSNQLVYFENIYVIMYLALIITLLFTFLKLQNPDENSPGFKQGKIAELLYWPVLLSAIIMLTILYLY